MDDKLPASLSENVIKELREKLGFTGIIITDDLAMDAVSSYVSNGEAATMAINAGNVSHPLRNRHGVGNIPSSEVCVNVLAPAAISDTLDPETFLGVRTG